MSRLRSLRWPLAITLCALLVWLSYASLQAGAGGQHFGWLEVWRACLRGLGVGDEETPIILLLRLRRVLTAVGVGASLALAGAYLQGLFRNSLASPAVLGVTAGASLGAALAIAVLGGFGASLIGQSALGPAVVSAAAFVGALVVTWGVVSLATVEGRLSVPTLLLAGIAINSVIGGIMAAVQSITLEDFEVARSILNWSFGNVDDRTSLQVGVIYAGLLLALLPIPFVARELDLFAGGEEDALALGVPVGRVKFLVLGAATVATACSVSVAGQIPFVGLVVPHLVRSTVGARHRTLLPFCALVGALCFVGCDLLQHSWLSETGLRPGAMMSLIGGPFFLLLLIQKKGALSKW